MYAGVSWEVSRVKERISSMDRPYREQFNIEVSASDATEEDIDWMTRQLLSELRELDIESAELTKGGDVPAGAKGDPISIGSIALELLPAVLPAVLGLVQNWTARGRGRTVKFKGQIGDGLIEFEGSAEELQKLIASLEAKRLLPEEGPVKQDNITEGKTKERSDQIQQAPIKNKPARAPRIFISYRRADSTDVTGRIYDRLVGHFGAATIFKDVDSIPPGTDFKEHLQKAVGKCRIFLVVIGDKWLQKDRLEDPRDFVRIEIEAALNRNILVIPLLVGGAFMPAEENLPPSLGKLTYRNAMPIRSDPDFHRDMNRLIEAISNYSSKKP